MGLGFPFVDPEKVEHSVAPAELYSNDVQTFHSLTVPKPLVLYLPSDPLLESPPKPHTDHLRLRQGS